VEDKPNLSAWGKSLGPIMVMGVYYKICFILKKNILVKTFVVVIALVGVVFIIIVVVIFNRN